MSLQGERVRPVEVDRGGLSQCIRSLFTFRALFSFALASGSGLVQIASDLGNTVGEAASFAPAVGKAGSFAYGVTCR